MKSAVLVLAAAATCAAGAGAAPDLQHVRTFLSHTNYLLRRKYRPLYHVTAPFGWLNDPAGFVHFRDRYHLFYQYYPYDGSWGPLHWGHAVSRDLVHWWHYPPALVPAEPYDRRGCLAGSVVALGDRLALFYTGEALVANETRQTQNVAVSSDGILFQKQTYNPVIAAASDAALDLRNPKVWRFQSVWYMLLGGGVGGRGALLLYTSADMHTWMYNGSVARSFGDLGHLWESPDAFELDGLNVLLVSTRGVRADGFRFRNLHQSGYVVGRFDYLSGSFDELEVSSATFRELDRGHDFYAAKSALAEDGRRLLVGWLGMRESEFREADEGWAGALTLVREVRLGAHGGLLTPPAREALELRSEVLEEAWYGPGEAFAAGSRAFELLVNASSTLYDVTLSLEWEGRARYTAAYSADARHVSVDRGGEDGERRADWAPEEALRWRLFVDRSSVELFVGRGELAFSSRVYPRRRLAVRVGGEQRVHVTQYRLRRALGYDDKLRTYLETLTNSGQ